MKDKKIAICFECGKEYSPSFKCRYCGNRFCIEHHLPEEHKCPKFKSFMKKQENNWRYGSAKMEYWDENKYYDEKKKFERLINDNLCPACGANLLHHKFTCSICGENFCSKECAIPANHGCDYKKNAEKNKKDQYPYKHENKINENNLPFNLKDKRLLAIIAILFILFVFIISIQSNAIPGLCPLSCNDKYNCTTDFCSKDTNFICQHQEIIPCVGNGKCEQDEYPSIDCPSCDDGDKCTKDLMNYTTQKCTYETITPCCGNNNCDTGENYFSCSSDCVITKEEAIQECLKSSYEYERIECIGNYAAEAKDQTFCNDITSLLDSGYDDFDKNYHSEQCTLLYSLKKGDTAQCYSLDYFRSECFQCSLKSNHLNINSTTLCNSTNSDEKNYCLAITRLDYSFCEKIKEQSIKKDCKNNIEQNDCEDYFFDTTYHQSTKPTKLTETNFKNNTETQLSFTERKELTKSQYLAGLPLFDLFDFRILITPIGGFSTLDSCTQREINEIDYSNAGYSTFFFNYKKYHFVYSIKLFYDLYSFSAQLRQQDCYNSSNASRYFKEKYNLKLLEIISNDFKNLKNSGFTDDEIVEIVTRFVQEIPYGTKSGELNRYPYETMWLMYGNCLDKSVILAQILGNLGYETYILEGSNHAMVGVACTNGNNTYGGKEICFIEVTNTFLIGEEENIPSPSYYQVSSGSKLYEEDVYGKINADKIINLYNLIDNYEKKIDDYNIGKKLDSAENNIRIYNSYVEEYNKLVDTYNGFIYDIKVIKFEN